MTAQSFFRQVLLEAGRPSLRRPLEMHRKEFYARVQCDAGLASERAACQVTNTVFAALKGQLSPGEADDILGQFPKDLKTVWEDS
jgi:uncharacterized protein (DUF2267 family)